MSGDSFSDATIRAKAVLGGPTALSRALTEAGTKISPQAISLWTQVPAERVLDVERLTGVSRHDLRPDIYGPTPSSAPVHSGAAA